MHAEAQSLRLQPQRPVVEFTEPAIVVSNVWHKFESPFGRVREWADPCMNALLRHTLPPTRLPFRRTQWALRNVSFNVYPGEIVAILGDAGAGKSTLLKLLGRSLSPARGSVNIRGCASPIHQPPANAAQDSDEIFDILLIDEPARRAQLSTASGELIADARRRDATVILITADFASVSSFCTRALCFSQGVLVFDDTPGEALAQFRDETVRNQLVSAKSLPFLPIIK